MRNHNRLKKALWTIAAVIGAQAALVIIYLHLNPDRGAPVEKAERLRQEAPVLIYRSRDGREHRLSELRGRGTLVHFWATWCPPCREELPALLDFARTRQIEVLAVSLDSEWASVIRFLNEDVPSPVVLGSPSGAARDFGVTDLPQTFVIDQAGWLRLRLRGPQNWRSHRVRATVREAAETG